MGRAPSPGSLRSTWGMNREEQLDNTTQATEPPQSTTGNVDSEGASHSDHEVSESAQQDGSEVKLSKNAMKRKIKEEKYKASKLERRKVEKAKRKEKKKKLKVMSQCRGPRVRTCSNTLTEAGLEAKKKPKKRNPEDIVYLMQYMQVHAHVCLTSIVMQQQ